MGRAVLKEKHARQRPALALLAVRTAALRLARQTCRLRRKTRHGVAELVAMPLLHLLVEVLHREIAVALLVEPPHARQFRRRRPPRRRLAEPAITQSLPTLLVVAVDQSPKLTARHAQKLARPLAVRRRLR